MVRLRKVTKYQGVGLSVLKLATSSYRVSDSLEAVPFTHIDKNLQQSFLGFGAPFGKAMSIYE